MHQPPHDCPRAEFAFLGGLANDRYSPVFRIAVARLLQELRPVPREQQVAKILDAYTLRGAAPTVSLQRSGPRLRHNHPKCGGESSAQNATRNYSKNSRRLPKKKVLHFVPPERYEHVGNRILFRIIEEGERFQKVSFIVARLGVLAVEELQEFGKAVALCGNIEIHEVAFCAAARNGAHFHARDVAWIGDVNVEESRGGKELWVGVSEETQLRLPDRGVERMRSPLNE